MSYQNTTLAPVAAEVINQVSGTCSAPFGDGLLTATESLDTVRAVEVLHNNKQNTEAYHLILALYDQRP